jgi:transposase-like protein
LEAVEQTLGNWAHKHRVGTLKGTSNKPQVTTEQMEVSRLLGRVGAGDRN